MTESAYSNSVPGGRVPCAGDRAGFVPLNGHRAKIERMLRDELEAVLGAGMVELAEKIEDFVQRMTTWMLEQRSV